MRKNILITGASTGLGEGMAREWAAKGCNLALCARRADKLEALQRELQQAHPDIRVLVRGLDVCDYDQVFEVFRGFRDELGSLDRVVVRYWQLTAHRPWAFRCQPPHRRDQLHRCYCPE